LTIRDLRDRSRLGGSGSGRSLGLPVTDLGDWSGLGGSGSGRSLGLPVTDLGDWSGHGNRLRCLRLSIRDLGDHGSRDLGLSV
jgi:hypothetical protein